MRLGGYWFLTAIGCITNITAVEYIEKEICVIGAGPAGTLSACRLLDLDIEATDIAWIDASGFNGGFFGNFCSDVQLLSNNSYILNYFRASSFIVQHIPDYISHLQATPNIRSTIGEVSEQLIQLTALLADYGVTQINGIVQILVPHKGRWIIGTDRCVVSAKKVILALGWKPKKLAHTSCTEIPLEYALTAERLAPFVQENDRIAVFGNGDSARLVIKALKTCGIENIINIVLPRSHGAQGATTIVYAENESIIREHLSKCSKAVYAIGFEQHKIGASQLKTPNANLIQIAAMDLHALANFAAHTLPAFITHH